MAGLPATAADRRIGERIQYARQAAHLTQRAVAAALGVSRPQIHHYEKGTNCISASSLQIVADLLGRPITWFLDPRIAPETGEGA
ncbi:helix-turn-helix transcriptional regulator [Methylobacterium sp. WL120]|uniref:helix-turn-helix domain-containing protein n=1 Tax=Methylobacterium sp. WL120 TaxID=2603887 RepID=UPI0011C89163|nr:helix-turn-helix transcriptional regulator [Methylobacterium sp. WL120]TXM65847.1 helix-turn-helix transcriptional regulator [Methylobacterium sp. WL120]